MNGGPITRSPISVDEGMAQRAAVEIVCGDRGQADRRRRDQPGSPRSRSYPKNDPQRNTRTGGWSALSARRAVTQARRWTQESHRKGRGATSDVRNRLWKRQLHRLANEIGLAITVYHLPPATSKWNKIEHRLFSYISINWRRKPLLSLETIIELISHTTTEEGLTVTAVKDATIYPTGIKVSDEEMAKLNMNREPFHVEWNYTIRPQ
jgi:DDE family transposase